MDPELPFIILAPPDPLWMELELPFELTSRGL
jgi:hypothetical protein